MANRKYNFTVGEVIGHWQYLGELPKPNKNGARMLILKCLGCGKIYHVQLSNLTHSKTKMCHACAIKHTFTKHNLSSNKLYTVFKDMHKRCEYEKDYKYPNYGGRGIKVCEEWADTVEGLKAFVEWANNNGYKEGLQLDRFDNDKGYSPENCRWITLSQNNFNRRGAKGYRFHYGKWEAYITVNKKAIHLGRFDTEEEALDARKAAELKYYGEYSPSHRN